MRVENLHVDVADPGRSAPFWVAALGAEVLERSDDFVEARVHVDEGGPGDTWWYDLGIARVDTPPPRDRRLHPDLYGGPDRDAVVTRLLGAGAMHLDIGQGDVPWVVLGDPEGNPFCVMDDRDAYTRTGPLAALPLDSADPERDVAFWQAITGWTRVDGVGVPTLRHPTLTGPLLELCPEPGPKTTKNPLHLDVRPDDADEREALVARVLELGGRKLDHGWGTFPWTVMQDPSGNELCILAPPSTG